MTRQQRQQETSCKCGSTNHFKTTQRDCTLRLQSAFTSSQGSTTYVSQTVPFLNQTEENQVQQQNNPGPQPSG